MPFAARQEQLGALQELTRAAAAGRGGALMVVGEAGMGKSALVDATVGGLDEWLVLRKLGISSRRQLRELAL